MTVIRWPFSRKRPFVGGKLTHFFDTGRCPDCNANAWTEWQDGGHDVALECGHCGSKFGVQLPPFNLIERLNNVPGFRP